MKKLLFLVLITSLAISQNDDSLKMYKGNEIIVSASRSEILLKNSSSFVSLLKTDEIEKINGVKLADKLSYVPGIMFKDYGYGGLKNISLRGLGGEHTLVLFNGEKINSDQNGACDFNNILVDEVERIEIIRGGSSAYYGADAIGGVINIIPKNKFDKFAMKAGLSFGSFNYKSIMLGTSGKYNGMSISASFAKENSDNDYKYRYDDHGEIFKGSRSNSDFDINQGLAQLNYSFNSALSMQLITKYFYADRGIPNIVTIKNSTARQIDEDLLIMSSLNYKLNGMYLSISPSYKYSYYKYNDPNMSDGISSLTGSSDFYRYGMSGNLKTILSPNFPFQFGLEFYSTQATCLNYIGERDRLQIGSFLSAEINLFKEGIFPLHIFPAVRYDYYDDFGGRVSPKIGINIDIINNSMFLKAGLSNSFRAPTFNDLYWNPGGNPDLKPEKSNGFDIGLSGYFNDIIDFSAEVNYFNILMSDRIIWVPLSGTIWKPKNIKDVSSKGLESIIELGLFDKKINFSAAYTLTETKNVTPNDVNYGHVLPFVPKHSLKTGLIFSHLSFSGGANFRFSSSCFGSESNELLSKIKYHHLTDAFLQYAVTVSGIESTLRLEINNIYDSEYIVLPYYPTPLRNYKLSFLIKY